MNAALRNFRSAAWILGQAGADARARPPPRHYASSSSASTRIREVPHASSCFTTCLLISQFVENSIPRCHRRVCITCGPDSPCQATSFGGFTRHKWENSKPRSPMHHNFYELNNRAPVCSCPDAVESPANDLLEPKSHWHLDLSSSLPIAIVNKPPR